MADETPMPLSAAELGAIAERAEMATPGPWHGTTVDSVAGGAIYGEAGWKVAEATIYPGGWANHPDNPGYLPAMPTTHINTDTNAAFIAAARTDIPRLLATVKSMQSALDNGFAEVRAKQERLLAENAALREIVAVVAAFGDPVDVDTSIPVPIWLMRQLTPLVTRAREYMDRK